ncbi:MAG: DUF2179 domain-containing protein [Chloroflexi bacterium]|nr:DUF2179 domain-containing protein [Chloroflexota bacterium]
MNASLWLSALSIFGLRVFEVSLGTLRMLMLFRGYRLLTWVLSFVQSLVFVIAVGAVLKGASHPVQFAAYAAGYATGTLLGMYLEGRLALGYSYVRIISPTQGARIAQALRDKGFAVTEIPARGRTGTVGMLEAAVARKDLSEVEELVQSMDPGAFITVEEIRSPRRGYFRTNSRPS